MKISYEDCEKRIKELAEVVKVLDVENIYPIPRGGLYVGLRLSHLTNLPIIFHNLNKDKTLIIDEILDSGKTKKKYKDFKHFYVIVDKQKENINEWVTFFWEEK